MGPNLKKLLSIVSTPFYTEIEVSLTELIELPSKFLQPLIEILRYKNGFYGFEKALHFFSSCNSNTEISLANWNNMELWKGEYGKLAEDLFFFAEDIFGCQYGFYPNGIYKFEPETGEKEFKAPDLETWASIILDDFSYETGYPLAHDWQKTNGSLLFGERLIPKTFFTLGGQYSIDNLYAMNAVQGMRLRAGFYKQIQDLPDRTPIKLEISD